MPATQPVWVLSLAIDPSAPSTLYVSIAPQTINPSTGAVLRSPDGGTTWSAALPLGTPTSPPRVDDLEIDPNRPAIIYAATTQGVFKSTDGGRTWALSSSTPADQVAVDPVRPDTVLATGPAIVPCRGGTCFTGAVIRTTDGGTTWTDPRHPISYVVAILAAPSAGTFYAGSQFGVFVTRNAGDSWAEIPGLEFPILPRRIAVARDPFSPTVYVAADDGTLQQRVVPLCRTPNDGEQTQEAIGTCAPADPVGDFRGCVTTCRTTELAGARCQLVQVFAQGTCQLPRRATVRLVQARDLVDEALRASSVAQERRTRRRAARLVSRARNNVLKRGLGGWCRLERSAQLRTLRATIKTGVR